MGVTIKDIAKLAGVSKTTVSKVLNNKAESISQATIDKIHKIMKEQNYVPNKLAQSLVTKKTKTIGLIIPDIRNPFFTDISRGAEDFATKEGYNIIFCSTDEEYDQEIQSVSTLCEKMVDGIIFAPSSNTSQKDESYKNINIPMVLVDKSINTVNSKGIVKVDNICATYEATNHLINLGHRKILFLSGPLRNDIAKERLQGFYKSLSENNIEDTNVVEGKYKYEWALNFIKDIDPLQYSAICCGNDLMAIGVIHGLREKNIEVPKDISVVGFDDILTAKLIDPSLTTVRQPAYDMGKKACEILINSLEDKETDPVGTIVFKADLIIRNSTETIDNI